MKNKNAHKRPAPSDTAFAITIDPKAYTGKYYPNSLGAKKYRDTFPMPVGKNTVSPYGTGMGFEIHFIVLPTGEIDPLSIVPAGAATALGSELVFNTVPVEIDPGTFRGQYRIGGFDSATTGSTVWLVADLWNILEIYRLGYGQFVKIAVSASGAISTSNYPGATACTQATGSKPARVSFKTRSYMLEGLPGLSGEVYVSKAAPTSPVVKVGGVVDLVVNFPVAIVNKNLKWPAPNALLGESPGGDPLVPVSLLRFVPV